MTIESSPLTDDDDQCEFLPSRKSHRGTFLGFSPRDLKKPPAPEKPWMTWMSAETKIYLILALIVTVWIILGGVFYYCYQPGHSSSKWGFDQALFYAVNVGLGIGYGEMSVNEPVAMIFTVVYCMMGSTFIAAAGGLFVSKIMAQQDSKMADLRVLKEMDPELYKQQKYSTQFFTDQSWPRKVEFFLRKRKWRILTFLLWLLWTAIGVGFSMLSNTQCTGDDIETSCTGVVYGLFFAVTSMSTAAQVAPNNNAGSLYFTTVWIFVGIPLYGAVMGFISETWINHYLRMQLRWQVHSDKVDPDHFGRICTRNKTLQASSAMRQSSHDLGFAGEKDTGALWGNYLEYRLRQMGVVDRKLLDTIKESFETFQIEERQPGGILRPSFNPDTLE